MKQKYRFAQLFIRLSRLLSFLIIFVGVSYSGYRGFIRLKESAAARYKKNPALDFKLEALEAEAQKAEQILKGTFPNSEDLNAYESPSALPRETGSSQGFDNLAQALNGFKSKVHQLKTAAVAEYERLIGKIRDKLLQHAQEIAGPKVSVTSVAQAPTSQPPVTTTEPTEKDSLYMDLADLVRNQRLQDMNDVSNFLERLEKESERPESKSILGNANSLVVKLESLLIGPADLKQQEVKPESAASTIVKTRGDVKAEQVAEDLRTSIAMVRKSVLQSWKLDQALENVIETVSEEGNRCQMAESDAQVLFLKGIEEAAVLAIQSIVLAFLILVMSDFFQSQLDVARNTALLAERP